MAKTFRELIDAHRTSSDDRAPDSMESVARSIGISRMQLYNLCKGRCKASEWTVVRIARVLGLPPRTVRTALQAAREDALQS